MPSSRLPSDLTTQRDDAHAGRAVQARHRGRGSDGVESDARRLRLSAGSVGALASPAGLVYAPQPLGLPLGAQRGRGRFRAPRTRRPIASVALTASTSEAYALLFKLLCDAGDHGGRAAPQLSAVRASHRAGIGRGRAVSAGIPRHLAHRPGSSAARRDRSHARRAGRLAKQPDRFVPACGRSDRDRGRSVHRAICCSSATRCSRTFRSIRRPRARRSRTLRDIAVCSLGGLSKSVGLPQLKLGWIGFGGPAAQSRGVDGGVRGGRRHVSVGRRRLFSWRCLRCSAAAPKCARQIQTRIRRNLEALRAAAARASVDHGSCVRRRMVGGAAGPGDPQRGVAGPHAADRGSRAGAPGILLRLRARGVSRGQPALSSPRSSTAASHRCWHAHRTSEQRCDCAPPKWCRRSTVLPDVDPELGRRRVHRPAGVCALAAVGGPGFVQMLPITEIPEAETSPYSSVTAMALDPISISLPDVEDFAALGGEAALPDDESASIDDAPRARRRSNTRWCARSRSQRAAPGLRAVSRDRSGPRHGARAALCRVRAPQKAGGSTTTRCSRRSEGSSCCSPGGNGRLPLARP